MLIIKQPEVVLLDLGLSKANSLELMTWLRNELSEVKVVAIDILPDEVDIVEFIKAGGAGFILKTASVEDYIATIQAVAKGDKVLPRTLTTSLLVRAARDP